MAQTFINTFHCKTLQNLPKFGIFGLKICHPATLHPSHFGGKFLKMQWRMLVNQGHNNDDQYFVDRHLT
jgi:hypothetical protein